MSYTLFTGHRLIVSGKIEDVVASAYGEIQNRKQDRIVIYDDSSGYVIDIDYRGTVEEVLARLKDHPMLRALQPEPEKPRGRGRPKLGVVAGEVTLLPRHWEWLKQQRGGASAAIRRLVDDARSKPERKELIRKKQEAIHRFLWDMASGFTDFEEASRAFSPGILKISKQGSPTGRKM